MSTYPETPGFKGAADTGRTAAAAMAPKAGTRRAEVLDALERLGVASAEQIAELTGRHWYCTRPRLSELSAMGMVIDTGQRAATGLGGKTIRYRLTTPEERARAVRTAGAQ